ncbi:MAG: TIGR02594 family protein [Cytophagia bacterium]|nr:TIGR02594 family protein [Cytophagia bacterium]
MKLPKNLLWLGQEAAPRHLLKAIELYGTEETVGVKHNPVIMGWAKETGLKSVYTSDEIPWCGLFMAVVMHRAGRPVPPTPLRALSWNHFGEQVGASQAMLADVLTFTRNGGGHVGIYVGEDAKAYHVLGGNQGNKVSVVRIDKSRLSQVRRPLYNNRPENIRKIQLASNGSLSVNEA